MGDIIDRAQYYDEQYRQLAIAAHFAGLQAHTDRPVAADCIDCGEEIPVARRKAAPSAIRCIECQAKHERIYGRQS